MDKRKLFFLITGIMTTMALHAQNSIDKLIDHFSTVGNAVFRSAVERNPRTGKVVKVVKTLKAEGKAASAIRSAFAEEARKSNSNTSIKDGMKTVILTTRQSGRRSVYMLREPVENDNYPEIKATIIIRFNQ
ncbi:MAG: DUF5024 domain-containing protein [Prevotellaceae bacterium]|nr:DUF5024 domain-containing protein [Prevotella sp.]MDD7530761.1 DUF5024 domain-containing protein [Prevotellaceae bacterium]MDY2633476.1 DUF5024 domain-containing protein [Prevotella sp.]